METIFDKITATGLIERIAALRPDSKAQWGKMDVSQMVRHCILSEEMYLSKKKYDRLFIGRLFGKTALRGIVKDAAPMKKNLPTHKTFKIKGAGNLEKEKQQWIALLKEYQDYTTEALLHPFFGRMSKEEIGYYVFKHTDHHLRQFNQ